MLLLERAYAQPTTLQALQQSLVRAVVADEHAGLTERRAGGQEAGGCFELMLGLPEVGDMVPWGDELAPEPERDVPSARCPAVKPASPEQLENLARLSRELRRRDLRIRRGPQPAK